MACALNQLTYQAVHFLRAYFRVTTIAKTPVNKKLGHHLFWNRFSLIAFIKDETAVTLLTHFGPQLPSFSPSAMVGWEAFQSNYLWKVTSRSASAVMEPLQEQWIEMGTDIFTLPYFLADLQTAWLLATLSSACSECLQGKPDSEPAQHPCTGHEVLQAIVCSGPALLLYQ